MGSAASFSAAVTAYEIMKEQNISSAVYFHGGHFSVPSMFSQLSLTDLHPCRANSLSKNVVGMKGTVLLRRKSGEENETDRFFVVSRSRCIVFDTDGTACVGEHAIKHGGSETRFVCAFEHYIKESFMKFCHENRYEKEGGRYVMRSDRSQISASVILSDDTDVFVILLSNESIYGYGVVQVLKDSYYDLYVAVTRLLKVGVRGKSVAMAYCIAGCDFTPSFYKIGHELFLQTMCMYGRTIGSIDPPIRNKINALHVYVYPLFLKRHKKTDVVNAAIARERMHRNMKKVAEKQLSHREMKVAENALFVSEQNVGSTLWTRDVRNYIADNAENANELICDLSHLTLQFNSFDSKLFRREELIVGNYWGMAATHDVSACVVGGRSIEWGYDQDGSEVLER